MYVIPKNSNRGSRPGERRGGRGRGTPNKTTGDVRQAIARLAEDLGPALQGWIERVAAEDPARAAEIFLRAIEYHIPKLQRSEVTGKDGGPLLPPMFQLVTVAAPKRAG